jgi:tetratricopeptide (TPR) repeat protein
VSKKKFALFLLIYFLPLGISFAQEKFSKEDQAKFGIAQSLNNLKDYEKAIEILKLMANKYPQSKEIKIELAKAYGYSQKLKEAEAQLAILEKEYPQEEGIKYLSASIYEANQQFTQARERYTWLLARHPEDADLILKVAEISSWLGDFQKTSEYYERLLKARPQDAGLRLKLADVQFRLQNYNAAFSLYEEAKINSQSEPQRYKNLASAYFNLKKYQEAISAWRELAEKYPKDNEVKINLANALDVSGNQQEAERLFSQIAQENPQNSEVMIRLAEILAARQQYARARKICEQILSLNPQDKMAKLYLARFASWQKDYPNALKFYDKVIAENPDWILPAREKARVLGWMRHYAASIAQYQKALKEYKPDQPTELEMPAKHDYYRRFDRAAIKEYTAWLAKEPDSLEALFDLAQLYSRQMQWEKAKNNYQRTLNLMPLHLRAKEALNKVELSSKSLLFTPGFNFYQAESAPRDTDVKYYDIYLNLKVPLSGGKSYLDIAEENYIYNFADLSWVNRQSGRLGFAYYQKPDFWFNLGYDYNHYSDSLKPSHNFHEEINLKPLDPLTVTLSHRREDVIENASTLKEKLRRDNFTARLNFAPLRRFTLLSEYIYADYNDENIKKTLGLEAAFQALYEPRSLKIYYRYEQYGFDQARSIYFSPGSFHFNKIGLEWRHYLNKEELFWGANDIYYSFRYAVNFDVHDQRGHNLYFDFHRDWNDRFSTHIEWSKIIYEHQDTYKEEKVTAFGKISF